MSSNNPTLLVSDIISDVEGRLASPGIPTATYFPWVSTAAQRVYQALASLGQEAREKYFGTSGTIALTQSTLETSITGSLADFASFIKVEVLYGASGDTRNTATKLRSPAQWGNLNNVSTTYRAKQEPLYYQSGDYIGIIPTPPESGANAYVRYVKRLPQYTLAGDTISIPYRFTWPITEYVQAKAIQKVNEDYSTSQQIENNFERHLEEIILRAADEINENDGTNAVELSAESQLLDDPLNAF